MNFELWFALFLLSFNSTVYKSSIFNYTSNPNQRARFVIGIGYDDSITAAQEMGAKILENHPAVLKEPEPWILVDELAASTINLQFYFWVVGSKHNILKVKSSVMRQMKSAFMKEGISIPDEKRERLFPHGIPVQLTKEDSPAPSIKTSEKSTGTPHPDDSKINTVAEGQLQSNDEEILEQARRSRSP